MNHISSYLLVHRLSHHPKQFSLNFMLQLFVNCYSLFNQVYLLYLHVPAHFMIGHISLVNLKVYVFFLDYMLSLFMVMSL